MPRVGKQEQMHTPVAPWGVLHQVQWLLIPLVLQSCKNVLNIIHTEVSLLYMVSLKSCVCIGDGGVGLGVVSVRDLSGCCSLVTLSFILVLLVAYTKKAHGSSFSSLARDYLNW